MAGSSHPYADATYRVVAFDGGTFGVEVVIPAMAPTMVTGLASVAAADAWITRHRGRTGSGVTLRRRKVPFSPAG